MLNQRLPVFIRLTLCAALWICALISPVRSEQTEAQTGMDPSTEPILTDPILLDPPSRQVPVQVDGAELDAVCYLRNGVTYAPLSPLLQAIGGSWDTYWDADAGETVAVSKKHQLRASPETNTVTVDGKAYPGEVSIALGQVYVPLRLVAEGLGGAAAWDRYFQGAAVTSPGAPYDARTLYWLSRVISAESRGEPFRGQIAVGNVVLNRVKSPDFPDTVPDVIFDRKDAVQFEPVENGTIYHEPAPSSVEAARRVLDGESAAGRCLFFYAPALSPGTWINANRTYDRTIGGHRFYR